MFEILLIWPRNCSPVPDVLLLRNNAFMLKHDLFLLGESLALTRSNSGHAVLRSVAFPQTASCFLLVVNFLSLFFFFFFLFFSFLSFLLLFFLVLPNFTAAK